MKKIALIGECMLELSGEHFGAMQQFYGGDSLNTATYLARISRPKCIEVNYITALGTDKLSQTMLSYWQADGIQTTNVLCDNQRQPGLYLISLDNQGERSFLYWRNQSAARYLLQHPQFNQVAQNLAKMDAIYLSGISLAILPKADRQKLLDLLKTLKTQNVQIIFDSNYRPALWEDIKETQAIYQQIFGLVDIALVTFDDEQMLWQDKNAEQTLLRLNQLGIHTIVIKQGAEGAIVWHVGKSTHVPTTAVAKVVDTTSAGDAFNAGFLNGYLQNKDLITCCQQGNKIAGIVISHKGAIIPKSATEHLIHQF